MKGRTLVVTAFDHRHDELGLDLIASLRAISNRDFAIGVIRLGHRPLAPEVAAGLEVLVPLTAGYAGLAAEVGYDVAYLGVKALLPELAPGYETYVWLDGDVWVQNAEGIRQAVWAAQLADIAAAPQLDVNYWRTPSPDSHSIRTYMAIYGEAETRRWAPFPVVNAGVFAARAASPLWGLWREAMDDARRRQQDSAQPFYSDQTPLHRLLLQDRLSLHPLKSINNWLIIFGSVRLDPQTRKVMTEAV